MRRHPWKEHRVSLLRAAGAAALAGLWTLACVPAKALASPLSGVLGYDYYDGPGDQLTRGLLGAAALELGSGADATVAAVRYDDSVVGRGVGLTGGLGLPLGLAVKLRGQVSRFVGDQSYRAWRFKGGPGLDLAGGQSLTLWYMHYADNQDATSDGALFESSSPLSSSLAAKLNASYVTASQGQGGAAGSVGMSWTAVPHLALSGEVGLAQAGAFGPAEQPSPIGHLPLIGQGGRAGQTQTQNSVSPTVLVGVRVLFP